MTCGIYAIVNTTNDKVYIGQAINIERRWKDHKRLLENKKHVNKHLENSYYKYGKENFNFIILHECNEENLNYYEMNYIILYESTNCKKGYNKTFGGEGGKHIEETRKKISKICKGKKRTEETRKKISDGHRGEKNYNYGKHLSEETRKKLSEAVKGEKNYLYGKHLTEEHRKKISEANKGEKHNQAKKIYVYNIITNTTKTYNCRKYLVQEFHEKGYTKAFMTGYNYLTINRKDTKVNTKIPFHEYVIFSTEELLNEYLKENNLIKEVS